MEFQDKLACRSADIWNCSFGETFPPAGMTSEDKDTELLKGTEIMDFQEADIEVALVQKFVLKT